MKRVLCVWLPNWPLQRLLAAQPELRDRPVVLYRGTRSANGRGTKSRKKSPLAADRRPVAGSVCRVVACSEVAAQHGVAIGLTVAEAQGLFRGREGAQPEPYFSQHDERADTQALEQLAVGCRCFSPQVGLGPALDPDQLPDTLLLDVTGCTHLFSSEEQFVEQVEAAFRRKSLRVEVTMADTVGAAWAVAHFAGCRLSSAAEPGCQQGEATVSRIVPADQQHVHLRPLPVAALRLEVPTLETLRELDVCTIGQLLALPRASWPAHLGARVVQRIDQALGSVAEPITPLQYRPPTAVSRTFPDSVCSLEGLAFVFRELLGELVEQLESRQEGVQELEIKLAGANRERLEFSLGLVGPSKSAAYLTRMLLARVEREPLPREVVALRIRASSTARLGVRQTGLFAESADPAEQKQFQQLIDGLSTRLGEQAVLSAELLPDAQPELAFCWRPRIQGSLTDSPQRMAAEDVRAFFSARPLWLKQQPQPIIAFTATAAGPPARFRWRNDEYAVVRSWGPERIETGWWRMAPIRRDYYRVETSQGDQFWLFRQISARDSEKAWFLHGVF